MKYSKPILILYFLSLVTVTAPAAERHKDPCKGLSAQDCFIEAVHCYCQSDVSRAEILFRQALSMDGELDAAWYYLGAIADAKRDTAQAEEYYLKASQADPGNFWYKAALAELYSSTGKNEEAIAIYEEVQEKFPGKMTPQCCYILGDHYMSEKKDSTAMALYEKALKLDPEYSPAHFSMAEAFRTSSRFHDFFEHINIFLSDSYMNPQFKGRYLDEVVLNPQFVTTFKPQVDTMIQNLVAAHPKDSTVLLTAGSYYLRTDEKEKGESLLKLGSELYPENKHIDIEYISVLYYMERWKELQAQTRKTMGIFPHDDTLPEILAVAQWRDGDTTGAISTYQMQLRMTRNPSIRISCLTALGDLYQETGNFRKAEWYYKKGLKENSDYVNLLNNYAYFLTKVGRDYDKGLKMSRKTIQAEPDNPTYLDTYGWLLYLTGEYKEAKAQFKRAFLYGGKEQAVIVEHYGDVLWALGDYDMAIIYWEQADKLDKSLNIAAKISQRKESLRK